MIDYQDNLARILDLVKENPRGLNIREIAELTGVHRSAAAKYLDVMAAVGKIEVRVMGKAKIYYLARVSVPQSLLDYIPGLILVLNANAHVVQANAQFLEYYSLTLKQVLGQSLDVLSPGMTREPAFLQAVDKTLRTRTPQKEFLVDVLSEGKKFNVTLNPMCLSDDSLGVIVIINDITGYNRQVPKKHEVHEDLFQVLIDDAKVPVCIAQAGKMRLMNTRLVDISGYIRKELLSRPFLDFVHPEDRDQMRANHEWQMQGKLLYTPYLFRLITKSGNVLWFEVRSVPLSWKGKPATLNFLYDITDHKARDAAQQATKGNSG
jgi:PAS domain S-box-containing protein